MMSSESHQPPDAPPPSFVEDLGRALYPGDAPLPLPRATLARIVETYDVTLRRAGDTPRSVLWRSRNSQRQRFRVLLGVLGRDRWRRGLTITDFGCGYGALFDHIRGKWFLRGGHYQGIDLCPRMVRAAQARIQDPRAVFTEAATPTLEADYTLCSGTFGLKLDTPEAAWREYVQDALRTAASVSRRGLAFNLLHQRTPKADQRPTLYYADPEDYLAFCRAAFGPLAAIHLRDDYTLGDFTIQVRFIPDPHGREPGTPGAGHPLSGQTPR